MVNHISDNTSMRGFVKLWLGPMFGCKSSSMTADVERYHIANKLCCIVKYAADVRYDHLALNGGLVTHAGIEHSRVPIIPAHKLADVFDEISEYEVVGIDEIQFMTDCVEIVQRLANMGKIVICAGLDGDCLQRPFGRVLELIPIAEEVHKLKAVCMKCCDEASFTEKIGYVPRDGDSIEDIGGADKYIAVCRRCRWNL